MKDKKDLGIFQLPVKLGKYFEEDELDNIETGDLPYENIADKILGETSQQLFEEEKIKNDLKSKIKQLIPFAVIEFDVIKDKAQRIAESQID